MRLSTRPLGNSGLHITRVGLGSWAIGGGDWVYGWGPQDDAESIATMRHALDLGINWIDTAAVCDLLQPVAIRPGHGRLHGPNGLLRSPRMIGAAMCRDAADQSDGGLRPIALVWRLRAALTACTTRD
jgi:aryl-alcohol dehydrogenase-like predicted oxidoreductase